MIVWKRTNLLSTLIIKLIIKYYSGFRLLEQTCTQNDETGSIYSIYKQKIDAMFESDSSSSKNSVQAKIEKMFCDVANDNGKYKSFLNNKLIAENNCTVTNNFFGN